VIICGRPDGRLSALASAEATVSLSVNQASSIQSLGATCESITIGVSKVLIAIVGILHGLTLSQNNTSLDSTAQPIRTPANNEGNLPQEKAPFVFL